MDQTPAETPTDTPTPLRLFNDVYFQRWDPPAPRHVTPWAPFARLPHELRHYVWLACLRRHRMIELDICGTPEDPDAAVHPNNHSQPYSDCNSLGNIVSGGDYVMSWSSRCQGPTGGYSPLLWVSREARQAALSFYRVQLPFFGLQRDQVLYLNPDYDVVSIRPSWDTDWYYVDPHVMLVDFLHDVRAYDRKGQGYVYGSSVLTRQVANSIRLDGSVAHLALTPMSVDFDSEQVDSRPFLLVPNHLHPIAAVSFTNILKHTLRSVLFAIHFQSCYRGPGEHEWPLRKGHGYHFAQTFPLARREDSAGAFHWLDADPRPGVDVDIRRLWLGEDPDLIVGAWQRLEKAFGITRVAEGGCDMAGDAGPRLHVCPRLLWPKYEMQVLQQMERQATTLAMEEDEAEGGESGPRAELARHLREEAAEWQQTRTRLHERFSRVCPAVVSMPRQGYVLDTETFEAMERLPCTAIGLWLFPVEALKEPIGDELCFDLSPVRPGLFLFEV